MNSYGNTQAPSLVDPLAAFWADVDVDVDVDGGLPAPQPSRRVPAPLPNLSPALHPALPAQGELWRTEELLADGYSKRQLSTLVRNGGLTRLRRGILVRNSTWGNLSQDEQGRMRLAAYAHRTVTTSADGLTFSHTSGARLHRLHLWEVDQRIRVTIPYQPSSGSHAADVSAHTRKLLPGDRTEIDGLPVTSLERTAVDCALILNYRQALILLDHALRKGADRPWLEQACLELRGARGSTTFRKALANADPRSESPGETLTRDAVRRLGLPMPVPQYAVRTVVGQRRLDFAWPEQKVALEFDGAGKYFDYQRTDQAIFQERRREKLLTELGWRFVRIEWKDIFQERALKARILTALRR